MMLNFLSNLIFSMSTFTSLPPLISFFTASLDMTETPILASTAFFMASVLLRTYFILYLTLFLAMVSSKISLVPLPFSRMIISSFSISAGLMLFSLPTCGFLSIQDIAHHLYRVLQQCPLNGPDLRQCQGL